MSDNLNAKVPYDLQIENQQLQSRNALAQALLQRALSQPAGQMIGPHYVSNGALGNIGAPVVNALLGQWMQKQNDARAAELSKRAAEQQNQVSPKDLLGVAGASLPSRVAAAQGGGVGALMPAPTEHIVNGQLVAGAPGETPKMTYDGRPSYGPVGQIATGPEGRPIIGQVEKTTNEAKFAPAGTNLNVNTGQKGADALQIEAGKGKIRLLEDSRKEAISASRSYQSILEAQRNLQDGMHTGATAEIALGLAKVGKSLGLPTPDASIANTESYRANMAREVFGLVKNLGAGTGISDGDRKFAEDAAASKLTLDNNTMARLSNIALAAHGNTLLQHERLLSNVMSGPGGEQAGLEPYKVPFAVHLSPQGQPGGLTYNDKLGIFETTPMQSAAPAQGRRKPSVSNW